jgi:N utilization substance protein B
MSNSADGREADGESASANDGPLPAPVKPREGRRLTARSAARMAAVQALYQMEIAGTAIDVVVDQFRDHRFQSADPEEGVGPADAEFFADTVRGVVRRQREIDPLIDRHLAAGWRLERIDSILRAILRAGTFELLVRSDVPARVVINEYIDLAHDFLEGEEPKVVNGLLDRVTRQLRAGELEGKAKGRGSTES